MKQVHIILQGKGGIGKSFVSTLLMQHFSERKMDVLGIDTDPVNTTLDRHKALNTKHLKITEEGIVNPVLFDPLLDTILDGPEDGVFVVDTGATTFLAICHYLHENGVFKYLKEEEVEVTIHSVLAAGQNLSFTTQSLVELFKHFPDAPICIWLNEHFGILEVDGKTFEQTKFFKDNSDKIRGLIKIPKLSDATFGRDIFKMMDNFLTFSEISERGEFTRMSKKRLRDVWDDLNAKISLLQF